MTVRLGSLIETSAASLAIDYSIFASIIYAESEGNKWAHRFEPQFYEDHLKDLTRTTLSGYVPPHLPNIATELRDRAYSYGLCQILGETARSKLHFNHDDLSELFEPELNVMLGATYLAQLIAEYVWIKDPEERMKAVVKRWNGTGQAARDYQEKVFRIHDCDIWQTILEIQV